MASPPFNIAQTTPGDSDVVSQFPAAERTFRDVVESWLLIEHNVQGRHDKVSLDDQNADLTIAADVVGIWNKDGALRTRNGAGAVTNIPMDASLLATLASPAFTGNPTAPTQASTDDSTKLATTEFVKAGLALNGPIAGGFRALVITNNSGTPDTHIDVDAEAITLEDEDGVPYRQTGVNLTIDCTTTGANGLDTGGLANSTWYHVWAIYNPATDTLAGLASLQSTANATFLSNLPAGYTAYVRLGARFTNGSAVFHRITQKGNKATYVVTSGSPTTLLPLIDSSTNGTYSTTAPTWDTPSVANFVPPTAISIGVAVSNTYNAGTVSQVYVAPSNAHAGYTSANPPLIFLINNINMLDTIWFQLVGTTIAWVSSNTGGAIQCLGWEDSI